MISDNIIVAIITGLFAFAGVVVSNIANHRRNNLDQSVRDQRLEDEMKELSKRVDAHNGMQDRIANIEKSIVRIETILEGK